MTCRSARNHAILRLASDLGVDLVRVTGPWPVDDPYALQARLRRAILAVPGHLVTAYTRPRPEEFRTCIRAAITHARELEDLLETAHRMDRLLPEDHLRLAAATVDLIKALYAFLREGSPIPQDPQEPADAL
jgi:four helix bundle protein